jgi:hypothetical protein
MGWDQKEGAHTGWSALFLARHGPQHEWVSSAPIGSQATHIATTAAVSVLAGVGADAQGLEIERFARCAVMVVSSNRDLHGPSVKSFKSRRRTSGPAEPVACCCALCTVDGRADGGALSNHAYAARTCLPLHSLEARDGLVTKSRRLDRCLLQAVFRTARGLHARLSRLTKTAQPSNSDSTQDVLVGSSAKRDPEAMLP